MSVLGIWFSCTIPVFPGGPKLCSRQLSHYNIRNCTVGLWRKYVIPMFPYVKTILCFVKYCHSYQWRRESPALCWLGVADLMGTNSSFLLHTVTALKFCFWKVLSQIPWLYGKAENPILIKSREEKKECSSYDCHRQDTTGVLVNFSHQ